MRSKKTRMSLEIKESSVKLSDLNKIVKISDELVSSQTKVVNEILTHCSRIYGFESHCDQIRHFCTVLLSTLFIDIQNITKICRLYTMAEDAKSTSQTQAQSPSADTNSNVPCQRENHSRKGIWDLRSTVEKDLGNSSTCLKVEPVPVTFANAVNHEMERCQANHLKTETVNSNCDHSPPDICLEPSSNLSFSEKAISREPEQEEMIFSVACNSVEVKTEHLSSEEEKFIRNTNTSTASLPAEISSPPSHGVSSNLGPERHKDIDKIPTKNMEDETGACRGSSSSADCQLGSITEINLREKDANNTSYNHIDSDTPHTVLKNGCTEDGESSVVSGEWFESRSNENSPDAMEQDDCEGEDADLSNSLADELDPEWQENDESTEAKSIPKLRKRSTRHSKDFVFHCPVCAKSFKCKRPFEKHQQLHRTRNEDQDLLFKCSVCLSSFLTEKTLAKHKLLHEDSTQCEVCGWKGKMSEKEMHFCFKCYVCKAKFQSKTEYEEHKKCHKYNVIQCSYCLEEFDTKEEQIEHLKSHDRSNKTCCICGEQFANRIDLRKHVTAHRRDVRVYSCKLCDFKHRSSSYLSQHMMAQHTGRHQCEICGKQLKGLSHLELHVKAHKGIKNYSCELCDYKGLSRKHLNNHMQIHSQEKKFQCDLCGQQYTRIENLKRHMAVHEGKFRYACEKCPKRFNMLISLVRHSRVHDVQMPYTCEICGKGSRQKYNITVHMRTHTGQKPFSCENCGKTFAHNVSLRQHKKTCHPMKIKDEKTDSNLIAMEN